MYNQKYERLKNSSDNLKRLTTALLILIFIVFIIISLVIILYLIISKLDIINDIKIYHQQHRPHQPNHHHHYNNKNKTTFNSTVTVPVQDEDVTTSDSLVDEEDVASKCGISYFSSRKFRLNKRIINGKEVDPPHSYPWIVSLYETENDQILHHFCAGTLITKQIVLTAAHCVANYVPMSRESTSYMNDEAYQAHVRRIRAKKVVVYVGINYHDQKDDLKHLYYVQNITIHSNYKATPCCDHDVALLKLDRPIEIDKHSNIICLPFSLKNDRIKLKELKENDKLIVAGWGLTNLTGPKVNANALQEVQLNIIKSENLCNKSKYWHIGHVYCQIDINYKSAACRADSGGPIMIYENNRWYIMAILSHIAINESKKTFDCDINLPSFSYPIHLSINWIKEKLLQL